MDTLESFLYFEKNITYTDFIDVKNNIKVYDILDDIKESATKNSSIIDLVNRIQLKIGKSKFNRGRDIIIIWLAYNKQLTKDVNFQGKNVLDNIGELLENANLYISSNQIKQDWSRIKDTKKDLEQSIANNKNISKFSTTLLMEFDNIPESSAYTNFEVEYTQFLLTLNVKNMSLIEIFNTIELNTYVPFASTMNYYKISNGFIPPDDWSDSYDDSLIIQVDQKKSLSNSSNSSNYENAIFKVDPITDNLTVDIIINTNKDNIKIDDFTTRSLSVFKKLDKSVKQIDESKVIGVFYFPSRRLNKYVFSDLVMNDPLFSILLSIDDHDKATKMKPGIYIHADHPSIGYITATLTEKIMIKGDKDMDTDYFEVGDPFIRVKISKASNSKSVAIFQEILGKLFTRYDQKIQDIIEYYKKYIPNFGDIPPPEENEHKDEIKLSEVAPDLFVTGYTRNCKPDRIPSIISEKEAMISQSNGNSVMKFPRDIPSDPDAFKFPMDGESQKYYTCNNPKYNHVGIKNNKLKNADIYPYVPCCFGMDQTKKPKYLNYYDGKELKVGDKKQNNIISTDKILKNNQFGTLPPNLETLFTIIEPETDYEYVRKGVYYGKNSFIQVVMEAVNEFKEMDQDEKEIGTILNNERLELAKEDIVPICRQELYDKNVKEILEMIKDKDLYFDPKLFTSLLENRFDCNIFIFSRKILDGEMILPRHKQAYYKNLNKQRCIYIYEHMGSESDHAKYPQCELILKYNTKKSKDNVQHLFSYEEASNIRNVYSRIRKSYALNKNISLTNMYINKDIKIDSQSIDSYGKTRRLNITYKNNKTSLITTPIQPIRVIETTDNIIHLTSVNNAKKLIDKLGIKIISQTVIGNVTKEINGELGNVSVSIPIIHDTVINGIKINQESLSFPEKEESYLVRYNRNKKISRYLIEYTIWIYSKYLKDKKIVDVKDKNIYSFAKKSFVIKPKHEYGHIGKKFKMNCKILDENKIVVHDDETIKRLVYVIKLRTHRDIKSVLTYHTHLNIMNYYADITDFDKYKDQIILFGKESVSKLIQDHNLAYTINDNVQIGANSPYFFRNTLIGKDVYLAQNTQSLNKASDIANKWITNGYNINMYANNIPTIALTVYKYVNSNNITKGTQMKGKTLSTEIKVLGYKIDGVAEYTVLLSLK
jgi:hypothetical protein